MKTETSVHNVCYILCVALIIASAIALYLYSDRNKYIEKCNVLAERNRKLAVDSGEWKIDPDNPDMLIYKGEPEAWITYDNEKEKLILSDKEPVPDWFKKELEETLVYGSFRVKFGIAGSEEDILIISGKALERLQDLAEAGHWHNYWEIWKCYSPEDEVIEEDE